MKDIQCPLLDQSTQWFNALLGRMFINVCKSKRFESIILKKFNRKTSRLKKPFFIGDIIVKQVTIGDVLPMLGKCQLHSFEPSGEVNVSADLLYTGGFRVQVETTAKLDLPKMKPIVIPLVLAIIVRRIFGRILLRIKAPPTDRLWIGFYELPEMDLKIEPIISTKAINLSMVHSIIQKRIEDIIMEFMVLPMMDDWSIPYDDDEHIALYQTAIPRSSVTSADIKDNQPASFVPSGISCQPFDGKDINKKSEQFLLRQRSTALTHLYAEDALAPGHSGAMSMPSIHVPPLTENE